MCYKILAALTVMLTFSMSFATLAQQKSLQTEISEAPTAQDRKPTILEIKATAEQDASNDINDFLWFSVGLGIAYVGGGVGGLTGLIVGEEIGSSSGFIYGPSKEGTIGLLIGAAAGALASINLIYKFPVHVPAGHLIGKSPKYVELYIDAYQRKMRWLEIEWAAAGTVAGCALPIHLS